MVSAHQDAGERPTPRSRADRYVLMVADSARELFTTAMLLHRFGYPVCTARNGREALDMVAVAAPSLVVTDALLPGMTGIELMRVLGSSTGTFALPVILLLPPGEAGVEKEDVEIGGPFILQKPVAVEALYRSVQAAMESTPRTNLRVRTLLPVEVNNVALDCGRGECAVDLSAQGMFIRTARRYRRSEPVAVRVAISGRTITADAAVLYTRGQEEHPLAEPGIAVIFTKIQGEDRDLVKRFVRDEVTRGIMTDRPAA